MHPLALRGRLPFAIFSLLLLMTTGALAQVSFTRTWNAGGIHKFSDVVLGDFNNDGREDIVTSSGYGISIILSNGDGTYAPPVDYAGMPGSALFWAVGDFNGDGHLDVIASGAGSAFYEYLNNGDGTFRLQTSFPQSSGVTGLVASDFNHDGKVDIAFLTGYSTNNGVLNIWTSNGNGVFTALSQTPLNQGYWYLYGGDFDGDGNPDVIAENHDIGTNVEILYGNGPSSGGSFTVGPSIYVAEFVLPADVDGDGVMDLIGPYSFYTTNGTGRGQHLDVYYSHKDRTFSQTQIPLSRCTNSSATVGDFNGDGINDIALLEYGSCDNSSNMQYVSVLLRNTDGSYQAAQDVYSSDSSSGLLGGPFVIRANQDTKPDLAFSDDPSSRLGFSILQNTSSGNFPSCTAPVDNMQGINICSPGSSTTATNVHFGIGSGGQTPMRKVEVWADGTKLAEQFAHAFSHYAFMDYDATLSAGPHQIDVYAAGWDNLLQHTSFTTNVGSGTGGGGCAQPTVPGVNICSPTSGSTVTSPFTISAAGRNSGTTDGMDVWLDGKKVGFYQGTTVNIQVTAGTGTHQLDIYAVGVNGELQESTVHFAVGTTTGGGGGGGTCSQPSSPGVNICSPTSGSTVTSPFTVSAAGRNSGTTDGMDVWLDGKKVGFYQGTTVNIQVSAGTGSHQLDIYAVGTNGELQEKTVVFSVGTTSSGGGGSCSARTSPGVTICTPTDGSTVSSPVQINAYGMNTGATDGMDVYIDGHHTGWYGSTTHISISVALGAGSHQLDVYAVGTNGELQESTVHFNVP